MFTILLFGKLQSSRKNNVIEQDCLLSLSSFSFYVISFHKINFDQREITTTLIDKNIIGLKGSRIVNKIALSNDEFVTVKKIMTRKTEDPSYPQKIYLVKELKIEMEILGSIRHKNIVMLYSFHSSFDCNLLVYEYLPNGNLWDALYNHYSFLN